MPKNLWNQTLFAGQNPEGKSTRWPKQHVPQPVSFSGVFRLFGVAAPPFGPSEEAGFPPTLTPTTLSMPFGPSEEAGFVGTFMSEGALPLGLSEEQGFPPALFPPLIPVILTSSEERGWTPSFFSVSPPSPPPPPSPTGWRTLTVTTDTGAVTDTVPYRVPMLLPSGNGQYRYIAPTGSDANPGSYYQPWATFAHAFTALVPGDVLWVRGGTYQEPWTLNLSGTAPLPITIAAYPGERVVLSQPLGWQAANPNGATVQINGNHIIFHGFEVVGCRGQVGAPPPDTFNQNCISLAYSQGSRILNNICHHAQHCGIKGGQNSLIEGNVLYNNGMSGNDHGIYNGNPDMVIRGNAAFRNTGWGYHLYTAPTRQRVYNNQDFENGMGGLLEGGDHNTVAYHVSFMNANGGLWWFRQGCHDNLFLNCILFRNQQYQVAYDQGGGAPGTQPLANLLDYSDIYPQRAPLWYSSNRVLAQTGPHVFFTDPFVVSSGTSGLYDFRLQSSSPAKGRATPVVLNGMPASPPDPGLFPATLYGEVT